MLAMNPTPETDPKPKARRRRKTASTGPELKGVDRSFGDRLRTQPIEGTALAVHEETVNDQDALVDDDKDESLDDREFTVQAVARQLVGDPPPADIDQVRSWADEQLLAGARAMLSFPPLKVLVNGVEQPPEPEELAGIPDPLTFASFREAVTAGPKRIHSSLEKTARRIMELGVPKMPSGLDAGVLAAIKANEAGIGAIFGKSSALSAAVDAIRSSPALTIKLPELDVMKGALAQYKGLSDTTGIAKSLTGLQATTRMAEKLTAPIDFATRKPILREPIRIPPPYHPEIDAIDSLGDRVGAMADNQAQADREQLEAMTALAELTRDQGVAMQGVIAEVKGLRDDQRWPNRAVIVGAFLAGALLVVGAITAVPIVKELFGL